MLLLPALTAFDLAQIIVEQMEMIYWRTLWEKSDVVLAVFRRTAQERHLSTNNEAFDLLVGDGSGRKVDKSILDAVLQETHSLEPKISRTDRVKLDEYLASIAAGELLRRPARPAPR